MLHAPLADLKRALIDTFVHARGLGDQKLAELPVREGETLLKECMRRRSWPKST